MEGLHVGAEGAEVAEAGGLAGAGDGLRFPVQPETVGGEGGAAACGGVGAKVGLGEGHREGAVGREVEFGVAFAPISGGMLVE